MPVAKQSTAPARQALLVGLGGVLGLVAVVFLVVQMDRLTDDASNVSFGGGGDPIFQPGNIERLADDIERQGPLLLPDPSGGDRDVWLNHIGDTDDTGWRVFAARPAVSPRDCYVEWATDSETFVDNCEHTIYPASGEGLPQYEVTVSPSGELTVDLGRPIDDASPAGAREGG